MTGKGEWGVGVQVHEPAGPWVGGDGLPQGHREQVRPGRIPGCALLPVFTRGHTQQSGVLNTLSQTLSLPNNHLVTPSKPALAPPPSPLESLSALGPPLAACGPGDTPPCSRS